MKKTTTLIRHTSEAAGTYTFDFSDVEATNEEKVAFLRWLRKILATYIAMNTYLSFDRDLEAIDFEENPIVVGEFNDNYGRAYEDIIEDWLEGHGWDSWFFKMKGLKLVIDYYNFDSGFPESITVIEDFDGSTTVIENCNSGFLVKQKATIKVTSDRITRHYDTYVNTVCNPYTLLEYTSYKLGDIYEGYFDEEVLTELYGEEVLIRDEKGFLSEEANEIILRLGKEAHLRYQEENKTM